MEVTFVVLLWGVRILFLLLVYLFLIRAFAALQRSLRAEEAVVAKRAAIAALVVVRSGVTTPKAGERLPLRAVSSIGRDAGNDVVLQDGAASTHHALLSFAGGEWWVEDSGSTNGTLLNGSLVDGRERVAYGDEIGIGRVTLRLEQA